MQFSEFFSEHGIGHKVSSAYCATSNAAAEVAVKRAKFLIQKVCLKDLKFHLLAFFNSPLSPKNSEGVFAHAKSPHELFYGRALRMPNMPTPSMLAKTSPVSHDPARQDKTASVFGGG